MHIISHFTAKPKLMAIFTMDEAGVITCDNADLSGQANKFGILRPFAPAGKVFPKDGMLYWEALPFHFTGHFEAVEVTGRDA